MEEINERPNVGGVSVRSGNGAPSERSAWSTVKRLKASTT